jgi:hypothetical protein
MHPNTFLRAFWRTEIRPEIFVAMSFSEHLAVRFTNIIEPAIGAINYHGQQLKANRVDLSKSGDSILTDIIDGIAHSVMVLADVSVVGNDSKTGQSYRNGNVMYEVGLALASRQSGELLIIRDDKAPFLFDVSTVPHMHVDFTDPLAKAILSEALVARLKEVDHVRDARLALAAATLTATERVILKVFSEYDMNSTFFLKQTSITANDGLSRLLDKQLIRSAGISQDRHGLFRWTTLGRTLASKLDALVPTHEIRVENEKKSPGAK